MMTLKALRTTFLSIGILLAPAAWAAPVYYKWFSAGGGDTISLQAINNAGQLLFSAGICPTNTSFGWCSLLGGGGGFPQPITGLPLPGAVRVSQFNAAGDMVGTTGDVPTFWRNGVAYDLRDPANAGLVFVADVGISPATVDFTDAIIVNEAEARAELSWVPSDVVDGLLHGTRDGLLNARGDFAYTSIYLRDAAFFMQAVSVPEPAAASLALLALALAVISKPRKN